MIFLNSSIFQFFQFGTVKKKLELFLLLIAFTWRYATKMSTSKNMTTISNLTTERVTHPFRKIITLSFTSSTGKYSPLVIFCPSNLGVLSTPKTKCGKDFSPTKYSLNNVEKSVRGIQRQNEKVSSLKKKKVQEDSRGDLKIF